MNQRSLDEIVTDAVDRICTQEGAALSEDAVLERVLADPDLQIIMDGYRMHDRSEGLEDVVKRDIDRMVKQALSSRQDT